MFQKWVDFVREVDPVVIICIFDLSYLFNRAKHLKVNNFNYLGRMKDLNRSSAIKETVIQSKQMGKRENKSINIEGRVQFDLLLVMKQNIIF
jgi:DNA polymerase delta subunit 1